MSDHFHDSLAFDLPPETSAKGDEVLYRENVLEHCREPHNAGPMEDASLRHKELNRSCGDMVELFLKFKDGRVRDVSFVGQGCAISQAATSMLTDRVKGMTKAELAALGQKDIFDLLGFPVGMTRLRCALLGLKTLQVGLEKLSKKDVTV